MSCKSKSCSCDVARNVQFELFYNVVCNVSKRRFGKGTCLNSRCFKDVMEWTAYHWSDMITIWMFFLWSMNYVPNKEELYTSRHICVKICSVLSVCCFYIVRVISRSCESCVEEKPLKEYKKITKITFVTISSKNYLGLHESRFVVFKREVFLQHNFRMICWLLAQYKNNALTDSFESCVGHTLENCGCENLFRGNLNVKMTQRKW